MEVVIWVFLVSLFWVSVLLFVHFNQKIKKDNNRRHISDVKPEEVITIQFDRIKGEIGNCTCINNDPILRKIYVSIKWNNYKETGCPQYEKFIFSYDGDELRNFSLLNPIQEEPTYESLMRKFMFLNRSMENALQDKQLEIAEEVAREIEENLKFLEKEKNNN